MKISTRLIYGMRLMFQLAKEHGRGYLMLKDIAEREGISEKYLSQIVMPLRGRGLVVSNRGVHGGYQLGREPADISARDVVEALDADFTNARPLRPADARDYYPGSVTGIIWDAMFEKIDEGLTLITLQTLVDLDRSRRQCEIEYHI